VLLVLLLVMERRPRRRGQKGHRRRAVRRLLLLWLVIPGHGSQLLTIELMMIGTETIFQGNLKIEKGNAARIFLQRRRGPLDRAAL
jgi:hypothetical protein